MNFASLNSLKEKALENAGLLTFSIANVESKMCKTGDRQMAFRATCDDGTVVTFFESTAEAVLEEIAEGKFRVKPGVDVAKDGGLIPSGTRKGVWD